MATEGERPAGPMVYLVGAGPGDPGLLTLKGKECLARADFVLYDQLVSPRLLDHARPDAERVCVAELGDSHPERCPHIHTRLIEEARKGRCVVRLKGGDPLIFGRGGEEAESLRAAGIPYEIVPGVTAALAAGSYLEIPLTHREHASAVAFVTGHENPLKPETRVDWQALAAFPGTVVVYMGIARLPAVVGELLRHGKPAETPVVVVHKASTGEQRSVGAPLAAIEAAVRDAGIRAPALVIVGTVAGLKPAQSWFEARPLLGQRVLVTRPRDQAGPTVEQLEALGAVALLLPTVEVRDPEDWSPVDAALEKLRAGRFDWLVFTSANGVQFLLRRLFRRGHDLRTLGSVRLATIGPATAAALREYHLVPDVGPSGGVNAEQLATALMERVRGQRVLLALADRGREVLREQLSAVADVEQIAVYAQADGVDTGSEAFARLRSGEVDVVTFTSPNIVRSFLSACDENVLGRLRQGGIRCVTNGPRISAVLRDAGVAVAAESSAPTAEALVRAVVDLVKAEKV